MVRKGKKKEAAKWFSVRNEVSRCCCCCSVLYVIDWSRNCAHSIEKENRLSSMTIIAWLRCIVEMGPCRNHVSLFLCLTLRASHSSLTLIKLCTVQICTINSDWKWHEVFRRIHSVHLFTNSQLVPFCENNFRRFQQSSNIFRTVEWSEKHWHKLAFRLISSLFFRSAVCYLSLK